MSAMLLILSSILISIYAFERHWKSSVLPLPPGPRGLPWIGNTFQMPRKKQWIHFNEWAKIYGNIYHLRVFTTHYIVLNSAKAASDLLDKRSAIYSDRPTFVMGGELVGRNVSVVFSHYGERLRTYRKLLHAYLNPQSSQMTGSIVLRIAYGHIVAGGRDRFVDLAEELSKMTGEAIQPGRWLVDSFPFLRHVPSWFPGAGFKRWASQKRKRSDEIIFGPLNFVQEQLANGTALPSFTADLLSSKAPSLGSNAEHIIACVASSFYAGTTASTLETFFLMMVLHPDIQHKAQAEIDLVVGKKRLPDLSDRPLLRYIECLIKEVYRFHPAAPVLIHSVMQDDDYEGYHIPAGSNILVNSWAICHDENAYPDPNRFWPERFMLDEGPPDPRLFVFGYGRRLCPGKHLAETTVFLCIARTLATINILPIVHASGQIDLPKIHYTSSPVSHPKPFPCNVTRRSDCLF
ncbi:cytochrome P450 [Mycena crocata]|nr:cytochrome P450 [Mycena crocata]